MSNTNTTAVETLSTKLANQIRPSFNKLMKENSPARLANKEQVAQLESSLVELGKFLPEESKPYKAAAKKILEEIAELEVSDAENERYNRELFRDAVIEAMREEFAIKLLSPSSAKKTRNRASKDLINDQVNKIIGLIAESSEDEPVVRSEIVEVLDFNPNSALAKMRRDGMIATNGARGRGGKFWISTVEDAIEDDHDGTIVHAGANSDDDDFEEFEGS